MVDRENRKFSLIRKTPSAYNISYFRIKIKQKIEVKVFKKVDYPIRNSKPKKKDLKIQTLAVSIEQIVPEKRLASGRGKTITRYSDQLQHRP